MTAFLARLAAAVLLVGCLAQPAMAQPAQPPAAQTEFVPVDQLPPEDRLPGAPLLIAAYSFILLAFFGYVMSVGKRLGAVQREVARLEGDLKKSGRG